MYSSISIIVELICLVKPSLIVLYRVLYSINTHYGSTWPPKRIIEPYGSIWQALYVSRYSLSGSYAVFYARMKMNIGLYASFSHVALYSPL